MKKVIPFVLFFSIASVAIGEVSIRVCEADGNTSLELADANIPFVYRDIMVGTQLTIIVSSDANKEWDGGALVITEGDRNYGLLSARDYNEITHDWEGSRFEAAGDTACVWDWEEPELGIAGFEFYGDDSAVAGDWFIIDYNAIEIGDCNVDFYDYEEDWFTPIYYLSFSHVRTRDFNKDTKVDFTDFAVFGSYWQVADCNGPNWCEGTDLDTDGNVDSNDLMLFVDYWLETTQ